MSGKTIGQLTTATSLDGTELLEIEQSGSSKYMVLNNIIGTTVITTDYTANNFNETIIINTASALTIIIPADLAVGTYKTISRALSATTAITIASSGAETIEGAATFITHASFIVSTRNDAEVTLRKKTTTEFKFVNGIIAGSNANGFYSKFPDGVLNQYGSKQSTSNSSANTRTYLVTFPHAYIDTNYSSVCCEQGLIVGYHFLPAVSHVSNTNAATEFRTIDVNAGSTTGYGLINWKSSGRWK